MTKPASPPRPVAAGSRLSPPKLFTHFALLDHGLGDTDPGFWTPTDATHDASRQRLLERMLAKQPGWAGLRLAIADLSGGAPELCGNLTAGGAAHKLPGETISAAPRCMETWEGASCTKAAILYAAFQLRHEVVALANANPDLTPAGLRDKLRIKWLASQVVDTKLPRELLRERGPKVELRGNEVLRDGSQIPLQLSDGTAIGPPKLDKIFDISKSAAGWSIRFQGEPEHWDTDVIAMNMLVAEVERAHVYYKPLPPLTNITQTPFTFFQKLWLTIEVSHDYAADECLDLIGFLYLNSLLWRADLFNPKRGGGMWVGRHYMDKRHWSAPPIPELKTRDGMVVRAGTSAVAGVAFMTLLHQGKLVDAAESQRMKIFMARRFPFASKTEGSQHDSSAVAGLARPNQYGASTVKVEEVFNKIGLGNFNNVFDIVLATVRDRISHKVFRYAVCFLDGTLIDDYPEPFYDVIDPVPESVVDKIPKLPPPPPVPPPPPAPPDDEEQEEE
jgi:hypothetical protein